MAGPVTSYIDAAFTVNAVGQRTDGSGSHTANTDVSAEVLRLGAAGTTPGARTTPAFQTAATTGMALAVGSGTTKADKYDVLGTIAGQESYRVRLDQATVTVTVPAAEASVVRTDEIYLVVLDNPYDSSSRALPRIGYRKGATTGGAPGPDAGWKASAKLSTVTVPAAATSIVSGNIADNRTFSDLRSVLGLAAGDVLGDVLATTVYNPSPFRTLTVSGSASAIDGHLTVTFVVPPSGQVAVALEALVQNPVSATHHWALMSAFSTIVPGTDTDITGDTFTNGTRLRATIVVSSLTPGASLTYLWGGSGTGSGAAISMGVGIGAAIMQVTAA